MLCRIFKKLTAMAWAAGEKHSKAATCSSKQERSVNMGLFVASGWK